MSNIKAIIFDVDGVLIDIHEYYSAMYSKESGINEEILAEFFDFEFQECLIGEGDLKEALKPYLKKWNISDSVEKFIKTWFESESKLNKQLIKTIKSLKQKNMPLFIMSNQEKYRAHYILETLGFRALFDHSFFSYEMHSRKPEEKAYRYVIDSLNYLEGIEDPQQIMFWDDKQENIATATQLGLTAHVFEDNQKFLTTLSSQDIQVN